jgi:hypothetical protein
MNAGTVALAFMAVCATLLVMVLGSFVENSAPGAYRRARFFLVSGFVVGQVIFGFGFLAAYLIWGSQ